MRRDPLAYLGEELDSLKKQNLYRNLRILEGEQKAHTTFDHRSVVNLSSNNYLGLTTHPRLRERALEAVQTYGVGSGSVRTIAGTMAIHMELERRLAEFKQVEAVVVFQSGFTANAGTVSAILLFASCSRLMSVSRGLKFTMKSKLHQTNDDILFASDSERVVADR